MIVHCLLILTLQNGENTVSVSSKVAFDSKTPCRKVWEDLADDGMLSSKAGISLFPFKFVY